MSWLYIRYGHSEVYLFRSQIFFQEISISQKKKSFQSNVYIPGLFPLIFDGWVIFKAITFENVNITALNKQFNWWKFWNSNVHGYWFQTFRNQLVIIAINIVNYFTQPAILIMNLTLMVWFMVRENTSSFINFYISKQDKLFCTQIPKI